MMPSSRGPFLLELWGPIVEYKFVSECKNRQAEWWGGHILESWRWQCLQPISCVRVQQSLVAAALGWVSNIYIFIASFSAFILSFICISLDQQMSSRSVGGTMKFSITFIIEAGMNRKEALQDKSPVWPVILEPWDLNTSTGTLPGFKDESHCSSMWSHIAKISCPCWGLVHCFYNP